MPCRLTLIAHASTAAVRAAAFPLDEGLDEAGKKTARALAGTLPSYAAAWTSPARRAVETAAALALDAVAEPLLRDLDVGRWSGRAFSDVEKSEPGEAMRWLSDPSAAPHGGESVEQLLMRIREWLAAVAGRRGRLVAVTHPAVIRAAIVAAIEAGPNTFWRIDVPPLGIAELGSNGQRWMLRSLKG
jgi:broad specificity phosphatase PhoE